MGNCDELAPDDDNWQGFKEADGEEVANDEIHHNAEADGDVLGCSDEAGTNEDRCDGGEGEEVTEQPRSLEGMWDSWKRSALESWKEHNAQADEEDSVGVGEEGMNNAADEDMEDDACEENMDGGDQADGSWKEQEAGEEDSVSVGEEDRNNAADEDMEDTACEHGMDGGNQANDSWKEQEEEDNIDNEDTYNNVKADEEDSVGVGEEGMNSVGDEDMEGNACKESMDGGDQADNDDDDKASETSQKATKADSCIAEPKRRIRGSVGLSVTSAKTFFAPVPKWVGGQTNAKRPRGRDEDMKTKKDKGDSGDSRQAMGMSSVSVKRPKHPSTPPPQHLLADVARSSRQAGQPSVQRKRSLASSASQEGGMPRVSEDELNVFIKGNAISACAAFYLRGARPEVQRCVLDDGAVVGKCKNSVLLARIRHWSLATLNQHGKKDGADLDGSQQTPGESAPQLARSSPEPALHPSWLAQDTPRLARHPHHPHPHPHLTPPSTRTPTHPPPPPAAAAAATARGVPPAKIKAPIRGTVGRMLGQRPLAVPSRAPVPSQVGLPHARSIAVPSVMPQGREGEEEQELTNANGAEDLVMTARTVPAEARFTRAADGAAPGRPVRPSTSAAGTTSASSTATDEEIISKFVQRSQLKSSTEAAFRALPAASRTKIMKQIPVGSARHHNALVMSYIRREHNFMTSEAVGGSAEENDFGKEQILRLLKDFAEENNLRQEIVQKLRALSFEQLKTVTGPRGSTQFRVCQEGGYEANLIVLKRIENLNGPEADNVLKKRINATMALVDNLQVIQEKIDKRGHGTDFTRLITNYVEEHSLPKEIEQALMMLSRLKVLELIRNSILFKGIEDKDKVGLVMSKLRHLDEPIYDLVQKVLPPVHEVIKNTSVGENTSASQSKTSKSSNPIPHWALLSEGQPTCKQRQQQQQPQIQMPLPTSRPQPSQKPGLPEKEACNTDATDASDEVAAAGPTLGGSASVAVTSKPSAEEQMCEWLTNLDGGQGSMLQYLDAIKNEFDADFAQIRAAKLARPVAPGALGRIEPSFFEVLGVKPVGHKLLFTKAIMALD